MNWSEERYVRLYRRDTADWLSLSFDAQGLFCLVLRKADLAGEIALGKHGPKAVAVLLGQVALWESRIRPALDELVIDGCIRLDGEVLRIPNYVAAQEAIASDRLRKRAQREREALSRNVTDAPRNVMNGHAAGQEVTCGHESSRAVTPAEPSEPSEPAEPDPKNVVRAVHVAREERAPSSKTEPWPADVLEDLRRALGLKPTDVAWLQFHAQSLREPLFRRVAGAREYIRRRNAPGSNAPAYVLKIIAAQRSSNPSAVISAKPEWEQKGYPSERAYAEESYRHEHDWPLPAELPDGWEFGVEPPKSVNNSVLERLSTDGSRVQAPSSPGDPMPESRELSNV